MLKPEPMTPTVYVEASGSRLTSETIVEIKWDASRVERKSFATLAEALEFAHGLCDHSDEDDDVVTV